MKTPCLFLLLFLAATAQAQEFVAMTNSSSDLNPISGFSQNDCVVDMNGDYLDDVVRVTNDALIIDFQQEGGGFTQEIFPVDFQNQPTWSIAAGDLDDNGYNDLLFGDSDAVSFVMANDDGTAYTEQAISDFIFSQRSTMADIDNDGDLDAFVCHDIDLSHPYRNDGNGNMVEDQSLIETINLPGNYANIWTDYDNDGDIDLYLTKCRGGASPGDPARTNAMYRNNGDGTFTEVGAECGLDDNAQSWSTVFEDFDNDGDFDAFIVNHDFQNRFFINNGDGTFTDIIEDTGINPNDLGAWENASGDFNNDGFVDIFSEMTKELYLNNGDLTFTPQDLPVDPGAIGDLNNDGFLDVVSWGGLYTNNGNGNNWLKVNTLGILSNKNGIGARVEIHGEWGMQIREVRSGQSFAPMSSLQIHFGLGQATEVDLLVVKWPSGVVTAIENPDINTTIDVPEAECLLADSELDITGSTDLCPGEEVQFTAPMGFSQVLWSNGEIGQTLTVEEAGTYSATLFNEDGCVSFTNSATVTVAEENAPSIALQGEDTFCAGGEVTLNAIGGEDYTWSNGMTGEAVTISEPGEYTVSIIGSCSGNPVASAPVSISVLAAPNPQTETEVFTTLGSPVTLMAEGMGGEPHWYDAPSGGTLLGTGDDFSPEVSSIMMGSNYFYVESVHSYPGLEQEGGKPDNSGSGGLPNQGAYSFFDAWEPFTLNSVKVYVPADAPTGQRTIQLYNADGEKLEEAIVFLSPGEHVLEINFPIPAGENFTLRCPENSLFRNSSGVNYPYPIGDVGELTGSFFGNDFYYYFYDWKISKQSFECISERIEVNVQADVSSSHEALAEAGVEIFPNPANTTLSVKMENPAAFIRLMDVTGKEILRKEVAGKEAINFDVSNFAAGIYTLQMDVDGKLLSAKVVVE